MTGFQISAAFKAAVELELFTKIAAGSKTPAAIAAAVGAAERGIRILADTLTVVGLLTKNGGEYSLTNHTGNIDVTLPSSASVDLDARSSHGSVEDSFPLRQKTHLANALVAGRSFAGTSNSGSSSVQLRSFSGKIRLKKQ